jgi:hypothetical protein
MIYPASIDLSGKWDFTYRCKLGTEEKRSRTKAKIPPLLPPEAFVTQMPVPGIWDDHLEPLREHNFWSTASFNPEYRPIEFPLGRNPPDASLPFLLGVGWYRRRFAAPAAWRNGVAVLQLGGVRLELWVWINGKPAGHWAGHSTPVEIDVSRFIQADAENEIILAVANTRRDRIGCDLRGYAGFCGGLRGPVRIKATAGAMIRDLFVRPQNGMRNLCWRMELGGKRPRDLQVEYRLLDPETGTTVLSGTQPAKQAVVTWQTPARGLHPWSDRDPKRYRIECRLKVHNDTVDEVDQLFGMRHLERRGIGLRLNGNPAYLRGGCDHAYFPLTCTPPEDKAFYEQNIRVMKDLGFNWIRCHTWVPPQEYLEAADELGMLVQVEPPVGFDEQDWTRILRACRQHPSVVIYCCGNEENLDETKIAQLRRMAALCRQEAPDALFNPQEALRGVEYAWHPSNLDPGVVLKPYPHNPKRLKQLKEFSDVFGQFAWGHLSYESSTHGNWRLVDSRLKPYARPCLSHELGIVGSYVDLDLEHRYAGARIGPEMYAAVRRHLQKSGVLDKATLYYRNSCALSRVLRKHNVETARLCRRVSGYDYLGIYDQHWHRTGYQTGFANEFYELKPGESANDVRRYNNESVLLADLGTRRVFRAGQRIALDLHVSFFRPEPFKKGTLEWHLANSNGQNVQAGRIAVPNLRPGAIRKLTTVHLEFPVLARGEHFVLHARLRDAVSEFDNTWDLWAFPACKDRVPSAAICQPGEPWVVPSLSIQTIDHLRTGGSVLLIGQAPLPTQPTIFHSCSAGRVMGNMATVIAKHPLLRDVPHDGFCDWQFFEMMEGGHAVVFDRPDVPFDPIVEVVSSFKRVVRQAALFELQVGRGKLLACTFKLSPDDPSGTWLLNRMRAYVASPAFAPRCSITPETLVAWRDPSLAPIDLSTDHGFDERAQLKRRP